ncbi:MAG: glycosyltransferase family 4 protein [Gammaproteobacteria bacterium]|nr:glycosyltransferase family 4 protein [Gammaproteobacteria bacterium]
MKVLHVFKTYFPDSFGGVEQVIYQIARGCDERDIETKVLALSDNPEPTEVEVYKHTVHRCKQNVNFASTGFSFDVFDKFKQLSKWADVIHYHYPWPLMDILHCISGVSKPSVVTYHSDIVRQKALLHLYKPLRNKFLGKVNKIVATSPNYLKTSQALQRYQDKVDVIPIGLDRLAYPKPKPETFEYWRERIGEKFFLFIGVLRYYKGLHILIEAANGTEYPIVIVGAGPVEAELKQQVHESGIENIHFVGPVSEIDKSALLELCFGVVFPSHLRSEAFGISLLEGAMYGKPMISSEIGTGTTYINIDQLTGLVVPPADANALRKAMGWLWAHPKEASQMGNRAAKRYQELFTADDMVKKYVTLYQEIINS